MQRTELRLTRRPGMRRYRIFCLILFLFTIPFFLRAEYEVKVIKSQDDMPEQFCSLAEPGDILVATGKYLALIGGTKRRLQNTSNTPTADAMGSLLSFVPAEKKLSSDLIIGSPAIRIKNKTEYVPYASVNEIKEKTGDRHLQFEASAAYEQKDGKKASVRTVYRFFPGSGRIDISSILTNTGKDDFTDLSFSLYFNALHSYYYNPYHKEEHPEWNFRIYQKKGHYLGWINPNPVEEEKKRFPGTLGPGKSVELKYVLLVDASHEELLEQVYQILKIKPLTASFQFQDYNGTLMELVVRDAFDSSIFFRSFLKNTLSLNVPLPEGVYRVRAHFFPAVSEELIEVRPGGKNTCIISNPPLGILNVKIKNSQGEFVPGKVVFLGLEATKTPYFKPENPVETGRSWESFKNSCYPPKDGEEIQMPVGTYLVYASCGPEYTLDQKVVEVIKEKAYEIIFTIDKVVEMPGFISLDPHLHTQYSDGRVLIPERLKSVAAEGIEVAVASDHNIIIDYSSSLQKTGLTPHLAVMTGCEVTTPDEIHYNTYPLVQRKEEKNNGAIYPLAETVSLLFERSRQKDAGILVQVNHPRAGTLGYFNNYSLEQETSETALLHFDTSFDIFEVMNGPYFYGSNSVAVEDWLHLLNRGYYFPIVGSSDSHSTDGDEPGYSRTYAAYKGKKGEKLDISSLLLAVREGRSFATNGPLVEFRVNSQYASGDTMTTKTGKVSIWMKAASAPWISIDEVKIIINGERKLIFPVKAKEMDVRKFEEEVSLTLKRDAYIAIEVLGHKTLYPVLQRPSDDGSLENAVVPYALTNPVFVDVDGNGRFDPPLPEKIRLVEDTEDSSKVISRK